MGWGNHNGGVGGTMQYAISTHWVELCLRHIGLARNITICNYNVTREICDILCGKRRKGRFSVCNLPFDKTVLLYKLIIAYLRRGDESGVVHEEVCGAPFV